MIGTATRGTTVMFKALGGSVAACVLALPVALAVGVPAAQAKNGDTHVSGQGIYQTLDCNDAALIVTGTGNFVTATGTCWGISVQVS